jgi:hypothetical protein
MAAFDWNIRFGDLLTLLGIIGGGLMVIIRTERQVSQNVALLSAGVSAMKDDFSELRDNLKEIKVIQRDIAQILVKVAVQQNTMDSLTKRQDLLDQRFEELRHGAGFVMAKGG